jgi:hypothetical protein
MRPRRSTALAASRFATLANHFCNETDGLKWRLTKKGAAALQTYAESAVLRILGIAAATVQKVTLEPGDVRRAERYLGCFLGVADFPPGGKPAPVVFPQRLCVKALKKRHSDLGRRKLRVSKATGTRIEVLYTTVVRFLLAVLDRSSPTNAQGAVKATLGPEDVAYVLDGFSLTATPAPEAAEAAAVPASA